MDLNTVSRYRFARARDDLHLADGEFFVAGGTWLFSEPQVEATGVVDLTTMGWCPIERTDEGLRIAATCTITELVRYPRRADWPAQQLFGDCANALLASSTIWNVATVGGNICRSFAAASMVSLAAALDGVARVLVVEQSHGAQFHRYLRAHYDLPGSVRAFHRPGPLPIRPNEIFRQLADWS